MPAKLLACIDATVGSVNRANEKRTSFARTGVPSCQRARGSIENAMESESGAHCQRVASCGPNPASPTVEIGVLVSARKSNSRSTACLPCVVLTSGGISASASTAVEMVSTLACTAPFAPASGLEQAGSAIAANAANVTARYMESRMTNRSRSVVMES